MEHNEVVLELIKVKKNQQYIMEVLRIDSQNDMIMVYQPNNGKGCLISNRPPPPPTDKTSFHQFNCTNLPQNYWKKYDLASKFVKMVRSRTPKITLHVDDAKCILFDTSPDFEAHFLKGSKFHISKEGSVKITHTDGTSLMLDSNSRSTCLSPDMQDMFEKSHKWHKYCLEEEKIREKRQEIYPDIIQFPLTIGRRSNNKPQSTIPNSTQMPQSKPQRHLSREKSFDSDLDYSKMQQTNNNNTTSRSNTSTNFSGYRAKNEEMHSSLGYNSSNCHELKSASTSSLTNNSVHSNLNQSYQNTSQPLQHNNRIRTMNYETQTQSPLTHQQNYSSEQLQYQNAYRPNSSSSTTSSSHNYQTPHDYRQQQPYMPHMQMKSGTPSPTMLANSMEPLSLMANHETVPVHLPQRDTYKYYN